MPHLLSRRAKSNCPYNKRAIGIEVGIHRTTFGEIWKGEPVNYDSLDSLFSGLGIDLNKSDWENPPQRSNSNGNREIPQESHSEKVTNALHKLNYRVQEFLFTESIADIKLAAAFLIHGKPEYGQRWLANRLSYEVPYYTDAFYISLSLKRHRNNIETMWQDLANLVKIATVSPAEIVTTLYEHWRTSTVILCFRDVDLVTGNYLKQLIEEIWQPLVKKVCDSPSTPEGHQILLFLIDNKGCKKKLGIPVVSKQDCDRPHIPIELKELEPFQPSEIKRWVGNQKPLFTSPSNNRDIKEIIHDIIDRNSTPVKALDAICTWCNLDWNMDIERNLRL